MCPHRTVLAAAVALSCTVAAEGGEGGPASDGCAVPPWTHVVFTTFKPLKLGTRARIDRNYEEALARLRVRSITFSDWEVDRNAHGTPVINSMFKEAMRRHPRADTFTFSNGDILYNESLTETLDAVAAAAAAGDVSRRFLMVGRRTNVDWKRPITPATYDAAARGGTLFISGATDYFTVARHSFDWDLDIPPFAVGRAGYDNWLCHYAAEHPDVDLIDATRSLVAVHMTDGEGNKAHAARPRPDKAYNVDFLGNWAKDRELFRVVRGSQVVLMTFSGETHAAGVYTARGANGTIEVRRRAPFRVGLVYDGTDDLPLTLYGLLAALSDWEPELLVSPTVKATELEVNGRVYAVRNLSPQLAGLQLAVDRPGNPSILMTDDFRSGSPRTQIVAWDKVEMILGAGLGVLLKEGRG